VAFGDLFNNPNGPWVATIRAAIYGNDIDKALADGQARSSRVWTRPADERTHRHAGLRRNTYPAGGVP
jgi:hypothetical protein